MIRITEAQKEHIPVIRHIARATWPSTFRDILSAEQITYMLEMMYSEASLNRQLSELGHRFLLAQDPAGNYLGFISYQRPYQGKAQTKIHKIYLLPQAQGQGVGKQLMEAVEQTARYHADKFLLLNVNKHNQAERFYQRLGFTTIGTEDIDIGQGFLMEDKIMCKNLE